MAAGSGPNYGLMVCIASPMIFFAVSFTISGCVMTGLGYGVLGGGTSYYTIAGPIMLGLGAIFLILGPALCIIGQKGLKKNADVNPRTMEMGPRQYGGGQYPQRHGQQQYPPGYGGPVDNKGYGQPSAFGAPYGQAPPYAGEPPAYNDHGLFPNNNYSPQYR